MPLSESPHSAIVGFGTPTEARHGPRKGTSGVAQPGRALDGPLQYRKHWRSSRTDLRARGAPSDQSELRSSLSTVASTLDLARRLRAVLFVDVVDSVRLIHADEHGTIARWRALSVR